MEHNCDMEGLILEIIPTHPINTLCEWLEKTNDFWYKCNRTTISEMKGVCSDERANKITIHENNSQSFAF
jgi:hypothetical protein